AADRLAVAVELDETAAQIRAEMHPADVAHQDRGPRAIGSDRDLLHVLNRAHVAASADEVLGAAQLDQPTTDLVVRAPDRLGDLAKRQAVRQERLGVDLDLVLLDEAAD